MKWIRNIRENPKEFFDSIKTIALAVLLALIFRYTVASPYKIPTGSMIPTLKVGDFIFVSKLSYGVKFPFTNYNLFTYDTPKRGDVVVFIYPEDTSKDFVKRVIGVEGDVIEIRSDILHLNGVPMERALVSDRSVLDDLEPFYKHAARLYEENLSEKKHLVLKVSPFAEDFGPQTVPKGHLLVMGDNRDNSHDGRKWGFLPVKSVRGRALFIWLSIDAERWRMRWSRLGDRVI